MKSDQAQADNSVADFKRCPAWGQGGQYVFDPVTKTRTVGSGTPAVIPEPVDGPTMATTPASPKQKGK